MKTYLNNKTPKVIAFDLDGVLTPRPITFTKWYEHIITVVQNKSSKNRKEAINYLRLKNITGNNSQKQGSVTNFMIELGFERSEWNNYKDNNLNISEFVKKDIELLKLIKKLSRFYCLTIVSNNTNNAVILNLKALGIPLDIFKQIVSYDYPLGLKHEVDKFQFAMSKCNGIFNELIVIGDKFNSDLKPVLDMGGSGILIDDYKETKSAIKLLLEIKTNK